MITAGEDGNGLTGDAQRRVGEEKGAGVGKYAHADKYFRP